MVLSELAHMALNTGQSVSPNFISEADKLSFVVWIEGELLLGIHQDAVLELSSTKHDRVRDM